MRRISIKWPFAAAGFVVLLLVLYAVAGYWLAPRLLRDALAQAAERHGVTLTVGEARTDPFALRVKLAGVEIGVPGGARLASVRELDADLAWRSLWGKAWVVQHVVVRSPEIDARNWQRPAGREGEEGRASPVFRVERLSIEDGSVRVADLALHEVAMAVRNFSTDGAEARYSLDARVMERGHLSSSGAFSLQQDGRLALRDVSAQAARLAYRGVEVGALEVHVPRASWPVDAPVPLSARAQLEHGGSVALEASVTPQPFEAQVKLEAARVPVALAQRFMSADSRIRPASGAVSAKGILHAGEQGVRYEGAAELHELRLVDAAAGDLLLGLAHGRTGELEFDSEQRSLRIGELTLVRPQGRLVIGEDGRINVVEAFKGGDQAGGQPLQVAVQRVHVKEGALDFADRSLQTPFEVSIAELAGTVSGFSTRGGDPALVALSGRVGQYGSARIRGTIDLEQPKSLANIRAQFRNLDLAQLTPYAVKFAGYRIRSGRLSADLRYRVNDGRLAGQNQLVFNEIELGDKVQSAGGADLPLELAVALLSDAEGRITLDIPVRGDLNDPQFDFGGLVARAIGNAIGRIVSAPFRALAGLLGERGGEGLDEVRFAPGSAALGPPQQEGVVKLAKALEARPQLGVTVRGGYDRSRDAEALRRETVRGEIMRRAGYKSAGPLDFDDARTVRAAESLYLERIGKRANLQALREAAPRYGRALVDLLAYVMPDDAVNAERLASERAEAVRSALVKHGIEPARVALDGPSEQPATQEGVATVLALSTH